MKKAVILYGMETSIGQKNYSKIEKENLWAQENTGKHIQEDKRPRNRNKNKKTKILRVNRQTENP